MTSKILIMTVGLPRSGKTSWARVQGHPIVNPDSVRLALYNECFIQEREPEVWQIVRIMVEALFMAGHRTVILDATNTLKQRRDEWRSVKWQIRYKVFDASKEVCIRRAKNTNPDLIPIIERMYNEFDKLVPEESCRIMM